MRLRVFAYTMMIFVLPIKVMSGTVTCSNCRPANPPACLNDCVFSGPADYARNEIRKMMNDTEIMKRFIAQAVRSAGDSIYGGPTDPMWGEWFNIDNVTQTIAYDKPRLVKTSFSDPVSSPNIITNCGHGTKVISREASDKITEESKSEQEQTEERRSSSTMHVAASASYDKVASASIDNTVQTSLDIKRRELRSARRTIEQSLVLKDDLTLPDFSFADETVTQSAGTAYYSVSGKLTTDARIFYDLRERINAGSWSDYVDAKNRTIDVTGSFEIPIHETTAHHDTYTFTMMPDCLEAAAKQIEIYRPVLPPD